MRHILQERALAKFSNCLSATIVENWCRKVKNQSSEGPKSRSGALLATQNDQRDVQEAPKGSQQVNEGIKAFPKCSFWGLCHLLGSVFCILGVVWGPKKRSKKRSGRTHERTDERTDKHTSKFWRYLHNKPFGQWWIRSTISINFWNIRMLFTTKFRNLRVA